MFTKEFYGKTVEDAIKIGLDELDMGIDEVDIEIITEGSKGIFGIGSKKAAVKITVLDKQSLVEDNDDFEDDKEDEIEERFESFEDKIEDKIENIKDAIEEKVDNIKDAIEDKIDTLSSSEHIDFISEFLDGLFERMGVEAEYDIKVNDDVLTINISSKQSGKLIGYRGETLDAIQYLTRLAVHKTDLSYKSIIVQTENYREKREQTLVSLAKRLANKVEKTNKKVVLEPMKPYERRIIHETLQDYKNVTTWSEGEGSKRHIVIGLKK